MYPFGASGFSVPIILCMFFCRAFFQINDRISNREVNISANRYSMWFYLFWKFRFFNNPSEAKNRRSASSSRSPDRGGSKFFSIQIMAVKSKFSEKLFFSDLTLLWFWEISRSQLFLLCALTCKSFFIRLTCQRLFWVSVFHHNRTVSVWRGVEWYHISFEWQNLDHMITFSHQFFDLFLD